MVQTRSQTRTLALLKTQIDLVVDQGAESQEQKAESQEWKPPPHLSALPHSTKWTKDHHWLAIGGQCGQSCACCRAQAYLEGRDPDGHWGACPLCLPFPTSVLYEEDCGETTCSGCILGNEGQLAHIGPNGCLGDGGY